jgi:23S rRNA (cytosine1962-C5)-methyltransferase
VKPAANQQQAQPLELQPLLSQVQQRLSASGGDTCRLFHGRGSSAAGWEQVSIDYCHPLILVTVSAELADTVLRALLNGLESLGAAHGAAIVALQSHHFEDSSLQVLRGALPRNLIATERGLEYTVVPGPRQDLDLFLERVAARRWLAAVADGKRVLNLFASTCAFSVVARSSGASRVVNLDMSAAALRQGQQDHQRNGITTGVSYLSPNLFKSWARLRRAGPFDIIMVDPPRQPAAGFLADRDYARIVAKLGGLCAPGAEVVLCLSSPDLEPGFLLDLVAQHAPALIFQERLSPPPAFESRDETQQLEAVRFGYSESI